MNEEKNILSKVVRLDGQETGLLWAELNRAPDPVPAATPECPDENFIALAVEGQLSLHEQEIFERHFTWCPRCRGLLDLLTVAFVGLPARLPPAPQEALPQELRRPKLWERLRKWCDDFVWEFPVSLQLPYPLLEGYADTRISGQLDEFSHRQILSEDETVQMVLFARGDQLFLSLLTEEPKAVRSFTITDARTGASWPAEKKRGGEGEILRCLGPAADLSGKTLIVSFLLRKRQYRRKVRIKGYKPDRVLS